jgi:hypothetical protein
MNTEILPANWFNSDGSSLTKCHRSRHEFILLIHCFVNAVLTTEIGIDFLKISAQNRVVLSRFIKKYLRLSTNYYALRQRH